MPGLSCSGLAPHPGKSRNTSSCRNWNKHRPDGCLVGLKVELTLYTGRDQLNWRLPVHPPPPFPLPTGISSFASYFLQELLAFETPCPPARVSRDHPWGGYECSLEKHIAFLKYANNNKLFYAFCKTRYSITTNLSSRVSRLNPPWNDPNPDEQVSI